MRTSTFAVGLILAIILSGLLGGFIGYSVKGYKTITTTSTSTVTTSVNATTNTGPSSMQGVVTGIVTVEGQTVSNLSEYDLVFVRLCAGRTSACPTTLVSIYPSGHYSALLDPGNYTVSSLYPSCPWAGCSSAFPSKEVTVIGGMQVVFNIDV